MYTFQLQEPSRDPRPDGYELDRITVWQQTKVRYATTQPPPPSVKYTVMPTPPTKRYEQTSVRIIKRDMIDEAVELKHAGAKPMVLNMADWRQAGGCVDAGSGAQEEECFRRSNYFRTLLQSFYPLGELDTIVSPGVEYYRRGAADGYIFMDRTETLDMIAAPALCFQQLTRDGKRFAEQTSVDRMAAKIHMLLRVAAASGNDTLILSAWGCGAFACPPYHVAKIFKEVLSQYDGVFKEIVFAIIGRNYEIFKASYEEA